MNEGELRKLSELRALLEGFAARQAASAVAKGAASPAALREVLAGLAMATRARNYRAFREADHALHAEIMELAGVPQLNEAWDGVWSALQRFHQTAFDECFPDARFLIDEHEHLVETIAQGDAAAAEDAARSHVEAVWFRLAEQQREEGEGLADAGEALQRAVAHIAFSLARPLRLEEVAARVAFTSPGNLSRLFRGHYGIGFQAYVQNLRMEKAAELLRATRLPVARVARRVGYRDAARFGQHFKRRFQVTPSEWRDRRE